MRPYFYGRYSIDKQDETSIENQLRNCRVLAERDGLTIEDCHVYADHAVTGQAKGMKKRHAWARLMDAWDAGLVDIVYANELSRLTRDEVDGALLKKKVESTGVAIVTGDGIDTRRANWQITWMMLVTLSGAEVRNVSTRTSSSMQGVLERGGMIAAPPFGYLPDPVRKAVTDKSKGARWVVHPPHAEVVREMYRMRKAGLPYHRIAAELNRRGIHSPRKSRSGEPSAWRQSSVHRLLSNPVYRGVVVYLGSGFTRAKLKRVRLVPETKDYPREEFRLVDDELWMACNPPPKQRVRGGVKHVLVGLVRCGDCGCKLSFKFGPTSGAASCPTCEHEVRAAVATSWMGYTSVRAAELALEAALLQLMTAPVLDAFRHRLRARLEAPSSEEEAKLAAQVRQLWERQQRLIELASNPAIGREVVEPQLVAVSSELKEAQHRAARLSSESVKLKPAAVKKQLTVDIEPLVRELIAGRPSLHEARAVLGRTVTRFQFVARPSRGVSVFEVGFVPGVIAATVADGEVLDSDEACYRITVSVSRKRNVPWSVSVEKI